VFGAQSTTPRPGQHTALPGGTTGAGRSVGKNSGQSLAYPIRPNQTQLTQLTQLTQPHPERLSWVPERFCGPSAIVPRLPDKDTTDQ